MDDFFLHELGHLLPADEAFQQSQWDNYLRAGGNPNNANNWQSSPYFQDGERYTNSWASAIGGSIGVIGYAP